VLSAITPSNTIFLFKASSKRSSICCLKLFLEEEERKIFAKKDLQYLIKQTQVFAKSLDTQNFNNQIIEFNFNHPVSELIWVIQNSSVLIPYSYGGNEWFNFSTQSYKNGELNGIDPMIDGKILKYSGYSYV